jgi:hypothetical protein
MSNAEQPNVIRSVYTGAPRGQSYDAWREDVCQNYCRLDVEPSDGERINCGVEIATLSSVAVATATGTSAQGSVFFIHNWRPIYLQ